MCCVETISGNVLTSHNRQDLKQGSPGQNGKTPKKQGLPEPEEDIEICLSEGDSIEVCLVPTKLVHSLIPSLSHLSTSHSACCVLTFSQYVLISSTMQ